MSRLYPRNRNLSEPIERLDIRRAFAFDKHFRIIRFGWRRQRALEIVPH